MRIPRIYTQQTLSTDSRIELEANAGHHVARVLRLRAGATLVVFNGDGSEYAAVIEAVKGGSVQARIGTQHWPARESGLSLSLGQGISRGERMDYTLQKSVELGIRQVTPLWTRRSQVRLKAGRLEKRIQHWRSVARSACEQSGRLILPVVDDATTLDDWCRQSDSHGLCLVLDPAAGQTLSDLKPATSTIRLLIGPEGGLDEKEIRSAKDYGFTAVRLGPRILRTETAAVAALSALQTLWGDLG